MPTTKLVNERWPGLHRLGDGTIVAVWPEHTYRFLMSDGATVDVRTISDNSDLRGALLQYLEAERIEGVVRLPEDGR